MKIDTNGLIVDNTGGDTAARTGFYFAGKFARYLLGLAESPWPQGLVSFELAVSLLTPNNKLIRNPVQYNDPTDTSRDQTRPMVIALGLRDYMAKNFYFNDLIDAISPKGFIIQKYPNGDVASPENGNEKRRAKCQSATFLGDAWLLPDVMIRCEQASKNLDDVGDDVNLFCTLMQANLVSPSRTAKLALEYYFHSRPTNYGVTKLGAPDNVSGALMWYFRADAGGNPEIAQEWLPIIAEMKRRLES